MAVRLRRRFHPSRARTSRRAVLAQYRQHGIPVLAPALKGVKAMLIRTKGLSLEMGVRIVADALMVNAAWLVALTGRFLWTVSGSSDVASASVMFRQSLHAYGHRLWLFTFISLTVFYFSGFYTRGRGYGGRYKALVVAQAVSTVYLVLTTMNFLVPGVVPQSRGVLLIAWGLTLVFVVGARLWSMAWRLLLKVEERLIPPTADDTDSSTRRVLVIGGAGYIGSALLRHLLAKGYRVRLLDLFLFGSEPIADLLDHPNLEIIHGDFRRVDKVVAAMDGTAAVIHLGAIVGDPACELDEDLTLEINLMATRMIAEVARGARVKRFIFASTCSVYGASDLLLDERSELNPVSLYARSKIASERILAQMADHNFAPVILRFGTIYGLSGRTRFDLVVNVLAAKAVVDGKMTLFGGDQWRPFVHVDDAARAVLMALEAPVGLVEGQTFNVGSDEQNHTLGQVAELIQKLVPTADLIDLGSDCDRRNYRVNFAKVRRVLDFKPQWTLEQGVKDVIAAIESGQVQDYCDPKHSNVKFLSEGGLSLLATQRNWAHHLISEPAVALVESQQFA
jgi:nucleoside-diphosphate-sugar epimerase